MARLAPAYAPRRPTETVLYGVVRSHLETFLAHVRETYENPLPRYVEKEFRSYLKCGVFAHGFVRCHCDACGHDLLIAYSCKDRGICPSCSGRRMANTAAHLVDRVLPDVPVRQFVLSLPFELRRLAAFKPAVLTALSRIFVEAVFAHYRARAKRAGNERTECGALTFVQRFGGSLNLNLHFHSVFMDGVFVRDEQGSVVFHPAPPPETIELQAIARRVGERSMAWLRRHGHLGDRVTEARSNEVADPSAIDACADIALQRGAFVKLAADDDDRDGSDDGGAPKLRFAAEHEGFNLHAGVHIAAGDDLGRERLCRYGLRPALSMDRLRRLPGGRIALRVKYARRGRAKHRIMTPLEFLARLSAIIPPPRYPLLRYHGVVAPHSLWRADVVPRPRELRSCPPASHAETGARTPETSAARATAVPSEANRTPAFVSSLGKGATTQGPEAKGHSNQRASLDVARTTSGPDAPILLAPGVLSVAHWDRLLGGLLCADSPRMNWARLLQRTFHIDALECPMCRGHMRGVAAIHEPAAARAILECLGVSDEAPRCGRARDPTDDERLESATD